MADKHVRPQQELHSIPTREEADELIAAALDSGPCEPEPLVRLSLILSDHTHESALKDIIHQMVKSAYDHSIVHSIHLHEYMEAIRRGENIVEEARAGRRVQQEVKA